MKGVPPSKLKIVEHHPNCKILNKAAQLCTIQVRDLDQLQNITTNGKQDNTQLHVLKENFDDIFVDPSGLPPLRGIFDHRIPLNNEAGPLIRNSCSPFASPIVLVGKKDGT